MTWPAIRAKETSIWQKLASVIALLAVVMFVSHGAAAEGTPLHPQGHHAAQAGASFAGEDALVGLDQSHQHAATTSQLHGASQVGKLSCCGDACLLALMPADEPDLEDPWTAPSRISVMVSSLAGQDPEGLQRPPRLSHRV